MSVKNERIDEVMSLLRFIAGKGMLIDNELKYYCATDHGNNVPNSVGNAISLNDDVVESALQAIELLREIEPAARAS